MKAGAQSRFLAATAEAWARSKGATDAEIRVAPGCIERQLTAWFGHATD
jgi:hypothetical protein